jgi:hypothetical protein
MVFMTHPTTAVPSASASLTTRRLSQLIRLPPGGDGRGRAVMAAHPDFWFWPTPAAATVALPGPGRSNFRLKYAIPSASPSPSLTTLPAPPNGTPSSTDCFPRFPKTGGRAARQLGKNAQIHSHDQHSNRSGRDRLSRPKRVSNPPQARPTIDLFTPSHPCQSASAMELYDSTEAVKLFLRRR